MESGWREKNTADLEEARKCLDELYQYDHSHRYYYDMGCIEAMEGNPNKAMSCLKKAKQHGYNNGIHMRNDDYLEILYSLPEFKDLVNSFNVRLRATDKIKERSLTWPSSKRH